MLNVFLFYRPSNNYYGSSCNNLYSNQQVSNNQENADGVISPEKRLDFVVSSACDITPTDQLNMSHNYNNVSFARSNNNVCSINYFSNLENSNNPDNHGNESYGHAAENSVLSSHDNNNQRQMNTIQMIRPIPKFTTFGNGNHGHSEVNHTPSNNLYRPQGISLPRGLHSGSEEDLHRALPIYLPSEGESTSSLSCTSITDLHHAGHTGSSFIQQLNDFGNLSLLSDDPMSYRQQLINATEDLQNQQQNKPPPLPARLNPPSHSPHQQQQPPSSLTFFPPVTHQFPGRSVKPMRKYKIFIHIILS